MTHLIDENGAWKRNLGAAYTRACDGEQTHIDDSVMLHNRGHKPVTCPDCQSTRQYQHAVADDAHRAARFGANLYQIVAGRRIPA